MTFTRSDDEFYVALIRIKDEIDAQKDAPFANILYDTIFDEKVLKFLRTKEVKTIIKSYIRKYNELIANSTYFKKGIFNNAATVAEILTDNGFFDNKHTNEITSQKQLEEVIAKEKERILADKDLQEKYDTFKKLIWKNMNLREFEAYLADHEDIIPELANIDKFREKIWKSYFKENFELYKELINKYEAV